MGALIATVFTIIVVAISSFAVVNPDISFDYRSLAKVINDGGGGASKPKITPKKTPTPKIISSSSSTAKKNCTLDGGTWTNNKCVFPTSTQPTSTTPKTKKCISECNKTKDCQMDLGPEYSCSKSADKCNKCVKKTSKSTTTPTPFPKSSPSLTPAKTPTSTPDTAQPDSECGTVEDCPPKSNCTITACSGSPRKCRYSCSTTPTPSLIKTPTPTITPPPSLAPTITQSDCDKCLETNSPSECAGACRNIGKTITTPLGTHECNPETDESFCSGNAVKSCSGSGTWSMRTCQHGCADATCNPPPQTDPFEELPGLGTYGLAGNSAIPLPQSAVTSPEGFQKWVSSVVSGLGTGAVVGAAALGGAATLPAGGIPIAVIMAQNALAAAPAWVAPTLTIAGTFPGVVANTKCLFVPESCTEQDKMNIFLTGVGVQQLIDEQMIQSIASQKKILTLFHGSAFQNNRSIMENGIYGVGNGIAPTLTDDINTAIEYASGQGLSMTGASVRNTVEGGYVYQVKVPLDKVTFVDDFAGEKLYTLSLNNPSQPGAMHDTWKALSPDYINTVYRINPNGEILEIIEIIR